MALVVSAFQSGHATQIGLTEDVGYGSRQFSTVQSMTGAQFVQGTDADQISKVSLKKLEIAASGNTTLDLNDDFPDPFGNAQNFAKLKLIEVYIPVSPATAQSTNITAFDSVTNGFTQGALKVAAGDCFAWRNGIGVTVTGGSNDKLKFTNGDATNTATIYVLIAGN